jgi:methyltransferase-like protein/16S rRNA G527 N7-methylase RsmG
MRIGFMIEAIDMQGFSYDEVQYDSYAYSFTHPEYLYTIARLFNLKPPDYQSARILEIGCAAGGNIIPIAFEVPGCQITGIDLSLKQITAGRREIADLGLENIELLHKGVHDVDQSWGRYDYIICHGVYSWVTPVVRDKILEVCRDNLAENGVGIISYNTLPGWNSVKTVRDMMLYHTREFTDPGEKAEQARSILHFVYRGLGAKPGPYADFLKSEIELLAGYPDKYLLHDHLEAHNNPLYFYQFIDHIARFKLRYLGDAPLAAMYHRNLPDELAREVDKLKDMIRIGQYMDFIRNQRFRATLVCHDNTIIRTSLRRQLKPEALKEFCFALATDIDESVLQQHPDDGVLVEVTLGERTVKVTDQLAKQALLILARQRKKPLGYNKLVSRLVEIRGEPDRQHVETYLLYHFSLAELVLNGVLHVYSREGHYTTDISDTPFTSSLARYQARTHKWVTNQLHQTVFLTTEQQVLIQYVNGRCHQEEIIAAMQGHFARQELVIHDKKGGPIKDRAEIARRVADLCREGLEKFANSALLLQ